MAYGVDLLMDENDDLALPCQLVSDYRVVIQRLKIRLSTFLGEWTLDTSKGLDFFGWLNTRPPPLNIIGAKVREEIAGTKGVKVITDFDISFDIETKTITIAAEITLDEDEIVQLRVEPYTFGDNTRPNISFKPIVVGFRR